MNDRDAELAAQFDRASFSDHDTTAPEDLSFADDDATFESAREEEQAA